MKRRSFKRYVIQDGDNRYLWSISTQRRVPKEDRDAVIEEGSIFNIDRSIPHFFELYEGTKFFKSKKEAEDLAARYNIHEWASIKIVPATVTISVKCQENSTKS